MEADKIKIAIAEDHQVVRKALISLLEENEQFSVVAEAENGRELLAVVKSKLPHVVLLDIEMPVMNGREALIQLNKHHAEVKVIVLSMHFEESLVFDMITNGASAYISKDSTAHELFKAITTVVEHGSYYGEAVSVAIMKGSQLQKSTNPLFNDAALSKREVQILKELCNGKTNKEIGKTFNISTSTVDFHRINIYRKTTSENVADLVKYAIRNKIILV